MEIRPFYQPLTDPNGWVKKNGQGLTLKGVIAAASMTASSKVAEAFYYTGLAVEAFTSGSPLPIGDQIHQLDIQRRALKAHRRVHTTDNLPVGEASPLKDLPAASLKRPVMMVPGWDTAHDRFVPLTDKLTAGGANGGATYYVQNGEFFSDRDCQSALPADQLPKDAKVFVTVFTNVSESPHLTAPQLKKNMAAVRKAIGGLAPDMVAYSQGGLCTRTFLSEQDAQAGRLVFLGTPNLGAGLASLSNFVFKAQDHGWDVDYLLHSQNLDPDDRGSIEFMTVGSPDLQNLNAGWKEQMSRTEGFMVVGHKGINTFNYGNPPTVPGDKLVPADNLAPAGVERTFIDGKYAEHGTMPFAPGAYLAMGKYFGWSETPPT